MANPETRTSKKIERKSIEVEGKRVNLTIYKLPEVTFSPNAASVFGKLLVTSLGADSARFTIGDKLFQQKFSPNTNPQLDEQIFKALEQKAGKLANPIIGDVGTVDNLIVHKEFIFKADDPAKAMHSAELIDPERGKVFELGASAGVTPLGEVFVNAEIVPDTKSDGSKTVRRISADKVVTMNDQDNFVTKDPETDDRALLAHAWYSRNVEGANKDNLIYGYIEGGNGIDVLASIRSAAEKIGIQNYAMAITVQGGDLLVNGAILSKMPEGSLNTVNDLVKIQKRMQINGGSVDAVGTVFTDRVDTEFKAMQKRSRVEPTGYTSHFHSDTAGHVVSIIPGKNCKTHFVLSPVAIAADMQPVTNGDKNQLEISKRVALQRKARWRI